MLSNNASHAWRVYTPLAALLSLALAFFAPWGETSSMLATLCRELLAGTNEGRQALLGSALEGPLGAFAVLPWHTLFPSHTAVRLGAATGWFFALIIGLRPLDSARNYLYTVHGTLYTILLASAIFASGSGANPQAAVFAACTLLVFRCGTQWCQRHQMSDLIGLAAGLAGLALCGVAGWCVALVAALFLPFGALRAPKAQCKSGSACLHAPVQPISHQPSTTSLSSRLPAVLLLGLLPMFYAFGVWMLMNRLIFGDAIFFLRPLAQQTLAELPRVPSSPLLFTPLGLAAVFSFYTLLISAASRNVSFLLATSLLLLTCAFGLALNYLGLDWTTPGLTAAALLVAAWLIRNVRFAFQTDKFPFPLIGYIVLFIFIGLRPPSAETPNKENRDHLQAILADIESHTPYGRLFICGYSGLALIDTLPDHPKIRPNLDLHIGQLRRDYHGQNLFILVPSPAIGRGAADAVQRTHGAAELLSRERAMLVNRTDLWTLYEIIGAPTQKQLDEWDD